MPFFRIRETGKPYTLSIRNWVGGLRNDVDAVNIGDNDLAVAQNVQYDDGLRTRDGCAKVNSVQIAAAPVTGMHVFQKSDGTSCMLAHCGTSVVKDNPAFDTAILTGLAPGGRMKFCTFTDLEIMVDGVNAPQKYDGTTAGPLGGSPPAAAIDVKIHWNRCFLLTKTAFYWSALGDPQTWGATDYAYINTNDGQTLTGMMNYFDTLVFGKERSLFLLTGSDPATYTLSTLNDKVGVASGHTMDIVGAEMFFLGHDNIYALQPTAVAQYINAPPVSTKIPATIAGLNSTALSQASAARYRDMYLVAVPDGTSSTNNLVLMYDWYRKAWAVWKGWAVASFYAHPTDGFLYWGSYDGYIYKFPSGTSDAGAAIDCRAETKRFTLGASERWKTFNEVYVDVDLDGDWSLNVQKDIDGKGWSTAKTVSLAPTSGTTSLWGTMVWGTDRWGASGAVMRTKRLIMSGSGQSIQFRFYNDTLDQYFHLRGLTLPFRSFPPR
ncbi:MAG: hypothetical protein AB1760_00340 [Pseudomonadota bacterium]